MAERCRAVMDTPSFKCTPAVLWSACVESSHGAGEMAQLAKSLSYKHEDLSSISRSQVRKPGVITHTIAALARQWTWAH